MAKKKKAIPEYATENQRYLLEIAEEDDTLTLAKGVLYKVLAQGDGDLSPELNNVVSVHYRGTTIFGQEFDSTFGDHPEAFRLRDVIEGWQIALNKMKVGDRWKIYIPAHLAYGDREEYNIPGGSTLIFDVELLSIS